MKTKIVFVSIVIFFMERSGFSQHADPIHFTYRAVRQLPKDKKTKRIQYELHLKAFIDKGWHIYSQTQPAEAIALPTAISIQKNPLILLLGTPAETGVKERYEDKTTGIIQYQYSGSLDFVQTVLLRSPVKTAISGSITYQACTDELCLPPKTINFSIPIR